MPATIQAELFYKRLGKLFASWNDKTREAWADADACAIIAGKDSEDKPAITKTASLQSFLTGYEMTETLFVFLRPSKAMHIFVSKKRMPIFEVVRDNASARSASGTDVSITVHDRGDEFPQQKVVQLLSGVTRLGHIAKELEYQVGKFAEGYRKWAERAMTSVDITGGIADVFEAKDDVAVDCARKSARLSALACAEVAKPAIAQIVVLRDHVKHEALAERIKEAISSPQDKVSSLRSLSDEDSELYDPAFPPMVQSGESVDLSLNADNSAGNIKPGKDSPVIVICGARYMSFTSLCARTYMDRPAKEVREAYEALLRIRTAAIDAMHVGSTFADVYKAALRAAEEHAAPFKKYFTKTVGFAMGLELKETNSTLNAKNERPLRPSTYYGLQVGFEKVKSETGRSFSLFIGDTVLIESSDGKARVLTADAPVDLAHCTVAESKKAAVAQDGDADGNDVDEDGDGQMEVGIRTRGRRKTAMADGINMDAIDMKNRELLEALSERAVADGPKRLDVSAEKFSFLRELIANRIMAYRNATQLPPGIHAHEIYVDLDRLAVLLPIHGRHVAVHVACIKNLSKVKSGDEFYLRFNFGTDGPDAERTIFLREVSFRSQDAASFQAIEDRVKEAQKKLKAEEAERQERADQVGLSGSELQVDRAGVAVYEGFQMIPKIGRGRQTRGSLQAQRNGLRFIAASETVDVLFENIRFIFFQPAKSATLSSCIVHLHLRRPMTIGGKKTYDVQFREEVEDDVDYLEGKKYRHIQTDEEAIRLEERAELRRAQVNKAVKSFLEKLNQKVDMAGFAELKYQTPRTALGFRGNPGRTLVDLAPTKSCLVALSEAPFFVLPLEDVEVAWFERVDAASRTRNFDLTFVYKDYNKLPIRIDSIERYYTIHHTEDGRRGEEQLQDRVYDLKLWLNTNRIPFFESAVSLSWKPLMTEIKNDIVSAANEGEEEGAWNPFGENGWSSYMIADDDAEDEDEEEGEDEYQAASGSEAGGDDDDYDEDEYIDEDEDEEDFEDEDEDEEGEDWDEMEERLEEEDRGRGESDEEEERPAKRRKR